MEASIFFDSYLPLAMRQAVEYAGKDGFVASLPQLLKARATASYDNIIWNTYFTANSEENVLKTPQGNHVVLTIHGTGIFSEPEKIERTLRSDLDRLNDEGLTGQYAAKITQQEAASVYLDKAQARNNTQKMGSWHPFQNIDTPNQAQTRVPNLAGNKAGAGSEDDDGHLHGYDTDYGMGGDCNIHNTSMINIARYVAVAPRDVSTSVRCLSFNSS